MPSIEQQRASFALSLVESISTHPKKQEFKSELKDLPARLHRNGLGQTLAFLIAGGDSSHKVEIYKWIGRWLGSPRQGPGIYVFADPFPDLMRRVMGTGLRAGQDAEQLYGRASTETRALALWLKRFAEAFL